MTDGRNLSGRAGGARAPAPSRTERLSQAEALYRSGDTRTLAELLQEHREGPDDADGIRLETLSAMALFDTGDVVGSIAALKNAAQRARHQPAGVQFGVAFALFLRESDFQAPAETLPGIAQLRQLASAVGDEHSLAGLHLSVARLEGCRGLCFDAHQHLEIARRLSGHTDDISLRCAVDLVEASLEFVAGNLSRSRRLSVACFERARTAGFLKYSVGSTANMALHALAIGDLSSARASLAVVLDEGRSLTYVRIAALDNLAQVDLIEGDLDACRTHLEEAHDAASRDRAPGRSWNDLANDQTRCSYFEQTAQWQSVVRVVDAADAELARRQFRAIRTSLLCAKARALAQLSEHVRAEEVLAAAVQACPRGAVDPQIVLEASKGLCLSLRGDVGRGSVHLERATAGCRAIGHRYHEWWIDRLRQTIPKSAIRDADAPRVRPLSDTALLLSDVTTMLGAGHSLDLLAQRATDILRSTSLSDRVQVDLESGLPYEADPSAAWSANADGTFVIRLAGSDRRVSIRATGIRSLDELSLLTSVAELMRTATLRTAGGEAGDDRQNLWPQQPAESGEDTVFRSPRMVELLKVAARLADTTLPVLITGETGTGKEILARLMHTQSRVRRGPFVPFNCSAIPRELVESQLFGHRRGAFTGAVDSFPGVIRAAERGTLFLDEIGDLELSSQPKLLRFLEGGEILPVGESRSQNVVVRIVAATNASLDDLVAQGRFRSDLFYRIGVARIELPPLRERKDEIPAFASLFLRRYSREVGRAGLKLGDDLIAALLLCPWPGNIRQLANEMRRVVALASDGQTLSAADLAPEFARRWSARSVTPAAAPATPSVHVRLDQTLAQAVEELEQKFIEHALDLSAGRVSSAAERLGLSRKGLFLKRRRRGLVVKPWAGR